jgi:hypothetical protein
VHACPVNALDLGSMYVCLIFDLDLALRMSKGPSASKYVGDQCRQANFHTDVAISNRHAPDANRFWGVLQSVP